MCTLLGYAKKHMGGTSRILHLRKKSVVPSRDFTWIKKPMANMYQGDKIQGLIIISSEVKTSPINGTV